MSSWKDLDTLAGIEAVIADSEHTPQLIFKHSTSCSLSSRARMILMEDWRPDNVGLHYLDLLKYRSVSNAVAEKLEIIHESPQVILLSHGEVVYDESHLGISISELDEQLEALLDE